jgi:hypothetical protein
VEIKRGHDGRHRGAARLVPADLQPVVTLANVVGVVDGPGGQPAQPVVEGPERVNVGGHGLEHHRAISGANGVREALRMGRMFANVRSDGAESGKQGVGRSREGAGAQRGRS